MEVSVLSQPLLADLGKSQSPVVFRFPLGESSCDAGRSEAAALLLKVRQGRWVATVLHRPSDPW